MKTSVVLVAYNNVELVKEVVESIKQKTSKDHELIIVDNHSLDTRTRDYIREVKDCILLDPGKNLGCHHGFTYGFDRARGENLVKLDDDTVIKSQNWDKILINTIEAWEKQRAERVAFIAPNSNVRHGSHQSVWNVGQYQFNQITGGTLGFSCVMIPRKTYLEFGPLTSMNWHNGALQNTLYGGEELYYAQLANAKANKYVYGYAMNALVEHLGNEYRDVDYVLWKYIYGYLGWTNKSLDEFKKDRDLVIRGYTFWVQSSGNEWLVEQGRRALKTMGVEI